MQRRRTRTRLGLVASAALLASAMAIPSGLAAPDLSVPQDELDATEVAKGPQTYLVLLDGDPVVTYDGGVAGLPSTAPDGDEGIDPTSRAVRQYREHQLERAVAALERVGAGAEDIVYEYGFTFNGVAATLTGAQASALREQRGVTALFENELGQLDTDSTPEFLGLTDPEVGLFARGITGEDVVVGVIDSGIWPENPSFSDRTGSYASGRSGKLGYRQLPGWNARCEVGEDFNGSDCNQKLIAAQYYAEGYGGAERIKEEFPEEFISPRDADGHGTHTASTAAGNAGVDTPFGTISGIAPRARISAYKVCWGYQGEGGCASADSVAAIDQAVADGVDVINFSISGTGTNYLDPVEVAFLFAADAGVVVNASAGNSGPGASTANHPSPWITTVAAGTEDAAFAAELVLGNGEEYGGAPSINNAGTDELPLVSSVDLATDTSDAGIESAALCRPDSLAGADGLMVVCDRGEIARTAKSDEVARAGGEAMVLANVDENSSLNSDAHVIPTIHVDNEVRQEIFLYLESTDAPTARQTPARVDQVVAPDVAGFSSRGPIGTDDVLKPDVLAPGVDILAAYSPVIGGRDFDFLSGTSMSSPHAAGHAALLKQARPDLSSAGIQSAMMTTAYTTRTDGSPIDGGPFAHGSGHIDPNTSVDPGLVYDAGFDDWFGFLCGTGQLASPLCEQLSIDPSDLNEPNIMVGELAGEQTVTRTVTNVGLEDATYTVDVDAPEGVDVTVEPSTISLARGDSATYAVTLTTLDGAATDEWTSGELTWSDGSHDVTSQVVTRPVQLAAADEVSGEGADGSTSFDITFGYEGAFTAGAHGMFAAALTEGTVVDDPTNDVNTALATGVGVTFHTVTVPEATAFTRIALYDEYTDGEDDLDLYVFGPDGAFVGGSGSGTSQEQVDVAFPAAGAYTVVVHGWQTDGPDASYTLFDWSVPADPAADDGSLVVDAPDAATLGSTAEVTASWSGLEEGTKHLGAVSYSDADGVFGLTLVAVDTD